ncbi:NACHT domain-containing protein [Nocardia sp. NPDC058176]|uniref:NACHT domain-containing protein n=1 Tax=Nocardia sp. NPDC058176 TaxID=3346368 RepID=UPI0036D76290
MGYLYENSNHERFQQLCQTLLVSEFPKLQCYPVGQPDGGRDGWDPESRTVLQVKFKRADDKEDNADWLLEALADEMPKVIQLANDGAEQYIIATNAKGTSHYGSGRYDKVQAWLDANFPIPAVCFWRDEIDRRLDLAPATLKLKYAEIVSLEDGIEVVFKSLLGDAQERRQDAVRAFIADQFEADRTVKFKQVSLSNDLLDLFIDVPVGWPRHFFDNPQTKRLVSAGKHELEEFIAPDDEVAFFSGVEHDGGAFNYNEFGRPRRFGTAEFILGEPSQQHHKLLILEGAPGQGKSTLAQYVCQVHRASFLRKTHTVERVPEQYRQSPFRLPIKVDLRDYAAFLDGNSPFANAKGGTGIRTLEVFLGELIQYSSGGIEFNPHDVLTLMKSVPILIFLDGLDEVADITAREALVSSVGEAIARWQEFDPDLQIVVTSRPSVFGRAPSFKRYGFVTLTLLDIDADRINSYAEKWADARGLEQGERSDLMKILGEKLELAHIQELTRNLMQLTILLSLIHQIGHSLPDQRTDLYSRYVDLFLTREADKSVMVRENRHVLLSFIQELAWVLQTQAESSNSAGSISEPDLQRMARLHLEASGRPGEIADRLFGGGLERIFVLVERIEGLYEFEVQPLREFFCAQYLYSTAPVGTYRADRLRGDRAQRFEALAANPFWLNVCRFYAGCCERGETGTLVLCLEEMIRTEDFSIEYHARDVGLALLQDWVFSNTKFAQDKLIRAIFDERGVQTLFAVRGERTVGRMALDKECGQKTLRDQLFEMLPLWPGELSPYSMCIAIRMNGGEFLSEQFIKLASDATGTERTNYLVQMIWSGAAQNVSDTVLASLITGDDPETSELLKRVSELSAHDPAKLSASNGLGDFYIRGILNGTVSNPIDVSPLGVFAGLFSYMPLHSIEWLRLYGTGRRAVPAGYADMQPVVIECLERVSQATRNKLGDRESLTEARLVEIFNIIIESTRSSFGDIWAPMSLAVIAAGMRTKRPVEARDVSMFEPDATLYSRARNARMRRSGVKWWFDQRQKCGSRIDRMFWAALVAMWSPPAILYALADELNYILEDLSDDEFFALRRTLESASSACEIRSDRKRVDVIDLTPLSARSSVLVSLGFGATLSKLAIQPTHESEPMKSFVETLKCAETAMMLPDWRNVSAARDWGAAVRHVRRYGTPRHDTILYSVLRTVRSVNNEEVLRNPTCYPYETVMLAMHTAQRQHRPLSLTRVSKEQDWDFG